MKPESESGIPVAGAWRFVFVMDGEIQVTEAGSPIQLHRLLFVTFGPTARPART